MLGRFVLPVSRLGEFERASEGKLPYEAGADPWLMSVLIDGDLDENLDEVFAFNDAHEDARRGLAVVDSVELKAASAGMVDQGLDLIPEELMPFFEVAAGEDPRGVIAALSGNDAAAKIRTGGVTASAIPRASYVAGFIAACDAADVPFKATAGLHHALRGDYRLTYEKGSPVGTMHGFLNVFAASVLLRGGMIEGEMVERVLMDHREDSFAFSDRYLSWTDEEGASHAVTTDAVGEARESFAISFGSCSFEEPIEALQQLGLLEGGGEDEDGD